jgi:hypothetical protein
MIRLEEIFTIGEHKCKVGHDELNCYWVVWLSDDGRYEMSWDVRDDLFKREFGYSSMYRVLEEAKENSPLKSINYRDISHSDSPDFYNLEDLTKYVEELRKIIFFNHFHELILN